MKTDVIKKLVETIVETLVKSLDKNAGVFNKNDVFIGQLLMIDYLFEHLSNEQFTTLLADESLYSDVIQQLLDIDNHIRDIYLKCNENSDEIIDKIKGKYDEIKTTAKNMDQKIKKYGSLLNDIREIEKQKTEEISKISLQIIEVIEKHNIACKELYDEYHNKIAVLRESTDALLKMEEDNKEIIAHLEENRHVLDKFVEVGITMEGDAQKKAFELEAKANEILKQYDDILINLLEFAKNERDEITRRQKIVKEAAK